MGIEEMSTESGKPSHITLQILCNCFLTISLMKSIASRFLNTQAQFETELKDQIQTMTKVESLL